MTNRILEEYLDRMRVPLRDLDEAERDALLDEMRAHLETAIEQRVRDEPDMGLDAATLAETRAFGEPEEIAAARIAPGAPSPSVVDGWPAPRRRRALVLAMLAPLLLIGFVVGTYYWVEEQHHPAPEPDVDYYRIFDFDNDTGVVNDTFNVTPDMTFVTFRIELGLRPGQCLALRIVDPAGKPALDEPAMCSARDALTRQLSVSPRADGQHGLWRIEARYTEIGGWMRIQAFATS